ncbi:MAG TPA: PRC-barrel domain-containing protein [Blastocatellia bacterium]|jgi:sporulation protein YlmC with PRC-barrel domain
MVKTKEFQGKLLISLSDGKNLGEVKDVYLDQDATKVVAAFLGKSGIINRKSLTVEISHIKLFGIDTWLTDASDIVIAKDDVSGAETYLLGDSLRGREIQTDGGTKIGTIGDILVDDKCNILGFSFDKLNVEGPLSETRQIARAAIINLGSNNTPMIAALDQAEKMKIEAQA